MTDLLIAPEGVAYPNAKRWTVRECEELARDGKIVGRYELIHGVIISKMGQDAPHASAIMLMLRWLTAVFGIDFMRVQLPIVIPGREGRITEPEPDIVVTREAFPAYFHANPGAADVRLVVEISDTTLRFDLYTKAEIYARAGVPEYWVYDVRERQIHRHRVPTANGYREIVILNEDQSIAAPGHEETIGVSALFAPQTAVESPTEGGNSAET